MNRRNGKMRERKEKSEVFKGSEAKRKCGQRRKGREKTEDTTGFRIS